MKDDLYRKPVTPEEGYKILHTNHTRRPCQEIDRYRELEKSISERIKKQNQELQEEKPKVQVKTDLDVFKFERLLHHLNGVADLLFEFPYSTTHKLRVRKAIEDMAELLDG